MKRFLRSALASFTTTSRRQPRASLRVEALEDRFALSPVSVAVVAPSSGSAIRPPIIAGRMESDAIIITAGSKGSNGGGAPPAGGSAGGWIIIVGGKGAANGIIANLNPAVLQGYNPQPGQPAVRVR